MLLRVATWQRYVFDTWHREKGVEFAVRLTRYEKIHKIQMCCMFFDVEFYALKT